MTTMGLCSAQCIPRAASLPSSLRRLGGLMLRPGAAPQHVPSNRQDCQICAAKKKGGKKKGQPGGDGGSGIPKAGAAKRPYTDVDVVMHNLLLVESFSRKVGRPIITEDAEIADVARVLFEAPFAVLSHDASEIPVFNYANQAALDLFEGSWDEILGLDSSVSADDAPEVQEARAAVLKETQEKGCYTGLSCWRRSLKGTRFQIHNATLWNVESPSGTHVGQAVLIPHWQYEDGTHGGPDAPVDEGELEPAEAAVEEQANIVRELKEGRGLTNQDEEVRAAVAELMKRKEKVERIKCAAEFDREPVSS